MGSKNEFDPDKKNKWCPMSKVAPGNRIKGSDGDPSWPNECRCIGGECALWVWENDHDDTGSCGLHR